MPGIDCYKESERQTLGLDRKRQRQEVESARVPVWWCCKHPRALCSAMGKKIKDSTVLHQRTLAPASRSCSREELALCAVDNDINSSETTESTLIDTAFEESHSKSTKSNRQRSSPPVPEIVILRPPSQASSPEGSWKYQSRIEAHAGSKNKRVRGDKDSFFRSSKSKTGTEYDWLMFDQSERLVVEYRTRLQRTPSQKDKLNTKLYKSTQTNLASKKQNIQLIHRLALLYSQTGDENSDASLMDEERNDCGSRGHMCWNSVRSLGVVCLNGYMMRFLGALVTRDQACLVALIIFSWWLIKSLK